jgi:hypothetical protein
VKLLRLDFENAEGELSRLDLPAGGDPEEYFRQEWVRALFGLAVAELRARCEASGKKVHFALFQRYDVEGPEAGQKLTYAALARELGIPDTQVVNHLAWARRQFRSIVLETLREACGSEQEFRAEARDLLGVRLR